MKTKIILITILIISATLRLWNLGINPPHLSQDEAALGYNAYSILKTGRDEYGQLFPLIFKSFGDYKPGVYVYLVTPFIAIFGLNEFAIRLPSALSGVFSVWLVYKIVLLLFAKKTSKLSNLNPPTVAYISAFFLAVSPWHVHLSRGAWEANVSLTLTLLGILFFLKSFKRQVYLRYSAIFFALTLITYQGAKLSTLIVMLLLVIFYWKKSFELNKKVIFISIAIGLLITYQIILSIVDGKTGRLEVYSIFSYPRPLPYLQAFLDQGKESIRSVSYYLFHSETLNFIRGIGGRYFNHFSGRFLFFEGDWKHLRHAIPNHGVLLLSDFIFLLSGLILVIKSKGKEYKIILLWLVLAPLPAVLSRDEIHAVRSLNMVIPLTITTALGMNYMFGWIKNIKSSIFQGVVYFTTILLFLGSLIYFIDAYFIHLPVHNAEAWNYGYKQVFQKLKTNQLTETNIIFQQSYKQPYIYYLFYNQYNPAEYQKQSNLVHKGLDVGHVDELENIDFKIFNWPENTAKGNILVGNYIAVTQDFPKQHFKLVDQINFPNGFPAFRILENL